MTKELFWLFWFFAPAGVANSAAFFSGKIPFLKEYSYPVDFHLTFRGKRILGDHKTVRGFIFGIIIAILTVYLQIFLYNLIPFLQSSTSLNYNEVNPLVFGLLSGFGPLFGDSVKSFFKRQLNISPGKSWFPFDQVDYILGGILFTSFYIRLTANQYFLLFLIWFLIHPLSTLIVYLLKLKEEPL